MTEKVIDEQTKYINFFKTKKNYGADKRKDFEDLVLKKVGDFGSFEKLELGILIQNIKSEIKQLKDITLN